LGKQRDEKTPIMQKASPKEGKISSLSQIAFLWRMMVEKQKTSLVIIKMFYRNFFFREMLLKGKHFTPFISLTKIDDAQKMMK
jgi:hypothetical protein